MILKVYSSLWGGRSLVMTLIGALLLVGAIVRGAAVRPDRRSVSPTGPACAGLLIGARHCGRFERHAIRVPGWRLEHPLGIGPLEFWLMWGKTPHNIWLSRLLMGFMAWLGFVSYLALDHLGRWCWCLRFLVARSAVAALSDARLYQMLHRPHAHRRLSSTSPTTAAFHLLDGDSLGMHRARKMRCPSSLSQVRSQSAPRGH